MAQRNVVDGVFAINKPMGMSSAQVIRDCQTYFNPSDFFRPMIEREAAARAHESKTASRRRSRAKRDMRVKMGHGGTLDPLATGVLILGVGRGTKDLNRFLACTKTYETVVIFGASTDTYDRCGRILKRRAYGDVTRAKVEEALEGFRGKYQQMPPLYSALKMNGKPLYEYAREGLSIPREIETREVEVSDLEIVEWYEPGEHPHRWPAEEAGMAEQSLAERVWRMEKDQAAGKKMSAEEEKSDREALAAHEDFKRRAEEKQDELVYDRPAKRRRGGVGNNSNNGGSQVNGGRQAQRNGAPATGGAADDRLMMSGALGELPPSYEKMRADAVAEATAAAAAAAAPDKSVTTNGADITAGDADIGKNVAVASTANKGKGKRTASTGPDSSATPHHRPGKGSNLIPPPPGPDTPPPWEGKGPPAVRIRMTVTSGFYVRSFCHDLGEKVGSAAMMAELARTRQSDFRSESSNCLNYADILKGEAVWAPRVERLLRLWQDGKVAEAGEEPAEALGSEPVAAAVAANVLPTPEGEKPAAASGDTVQTEKTEAETTAEVDDQDEKQESRSIGTESEWNGFSDAAEEAPSPAAK